jgi:branched-chain amino acid transport system permease protein
MLGAFFGFQISRWFGFWPALLVAPLLAGLIGTVVERYGLRHVHKNGHVAEPLFTWPTLGKERNSPARNRDVGSY